MRQEERGRFKKRKEAAGKRALARVEGVNPNSLQKTPQNRMYTPVQMNDWQLHETSLTLNKKNQAWKSTHSTQYDVVSESRKQKLVTSVLCCQQSEWGAPLRLGWTGRGCDWEWGQGAWLLVILCFLTWGLVWWAWDLYDMSTFLYKYYISVES